jgi:hypothetical protein
MDGTKAELRQALLQTVQHELVPVAVIGEINEAWQ